MKNNIIFLILILSLTTSDLFSQKSDIYLPPTIQKLYEGNTRSYDGKPGTEYWINRADYDLEAELVPDSSYLFGKGTITYYNNSPDTIRNVVIQLLPDLFRKGNSIDFNIGDFDLTDGMVLKNFKVNDSLLTENDLRRRFGTNLYLRLPESLAPDANFRLYLEWGFQIPKRATVRMGKYGKDTYFIGYWYPKIAVYDDVSGWDQENYSGALEFYNDFGDYNMKITVPSDYTVWGTGELQNAQEVLPSSIYEKYYKAKSSDEVVKIITSEDIRNRTIKKGSAKTWEFSANHVPDVTFACANNYLWEGSSVVVDDESGRRVFVDVAFKDSTINWKDAAKISRASVEYQSKVMPGVPFPYPEMTSFCNGEGGGGMESPMMANDGAPQNYGGFVGLLFHEISHTYFPFYMGTSERRYAWMDEGWATFFPSEFVPQHDSTFSQAEYAANRYGRMFATEQNLPLIIPTTSLKGMSLYFSAYGKSFLAYLALEHLLGKEKFKEALKEYIHRWNGKHPTAYDFFFTFDDKTEEDLTWFWNKWFYSFGTIDLGLKFANNDNALVVYNKGTLPVPAEILITYDDGSEDTIRQNISVWKDGNTEVTIPLHKSIIKAELIHIEFPDTDQLNDIVTK